MIFFDKEVIKAMYRRYVSENDNPEIYKWLMVEYIMNAILNLLVACCIIFSMLFSLKIIFDEVLNVKSKDYYSKLIENGNACEVLNGGSSIQLKQIWHCDNAYKAQEESKKDGSHFKVLRKIKAAN